MLKSEETVLDDIIYALGEEDRIKSRERRFLLLLFSPAIVSFIASILGLQILR